jgi:hypothetical protein
MGLSIWRLVEPSDATDQRQALIRRPTHRALI